MGKFAPVPLAVIAAAWLGMIAQVTIGFGGGRLIPQEFFSAASIAMMVFVMVESKNNRTRALIFASAALIEFAFMHFLWDVPLPLALALTPLLMVMGGGMGPAVVSVAALACRAYASEGSARVKWLGTLGWFMLVQVFAMYCLTAIWGWHALGSGTYDHAFYTADLSLGGDISAWIGKISREFPLLLTALTLAYKQLPAMLIFAYWHHGHALRPGPQPLLAFALSVPITTLFLFVPAYGPLQIFGTLFPFEVPAEFSSYTRIAPKDTLIHNAMPSMHMLWALLLLFISLHYPLWVRAVMAVFALLTAGATMALGEHYFVDLLVALPLAVTMMALLYALPPFRRDTWGAGVGAGLLAAALLLGMCFYSDQLTGWISWPILIVTITWCGRWTLQLHRSAAQL